MRARTRCLPAACLAAACLAGIAGSAAAETIDLPCRLPADARYTLAIEQHGWTREGMPTTIRIARSLVFGRDEQGSWAELGAGRATSDLAGPERERLALLYRPGREATARMRLDASGRIVAVEGLDRLWRDYLAQLEELAALVERQGESAARTRAMLAGLAEADEATRIALIVGVVEPLLRHCGQSVEAQPGASAQTALVVARTETPAAREETRYEVARASGIAMRVERRLTPLAQPERPQTESWQLTPSAP